MRQLPLPARGSVVPEALKREVIRFLQSKLPEWMKIDTTVEVGGDPRPGFISARDASRKLELSDPTVGTFLNRGKGGMKFLRAVARLRYGKEDITRLEAEASDWADANPEIAHQYVIAEGVERVMRIAERVRAPVDAVRRVTTELAAKNGEATDEQIASMLVGAAPSGRVIDDDIGGGTKVLGPPKRMARRDGT